MRNVRRRMEWIWFIPAMLTGMLSNAQSPLDSISEAKAAGLVGYFANDSMSGRGNGTVRLLQVGALIGDHFFEAGMKPFHGTSSYFLPFRPFGGPSKYNTDDLKINGKSVGRDNFRYLHSSPGAYGELSLKDFQVIRIDTNFSEDILLRYKDATGMVLLWTKHKQPGKKDVFPKQMKLSGELMKPNILLLYSPDEPVALELSGNKNYYGDLDYNVVGMLPGKSKPDEIVLFSAHYDHEGIFSNGEIMNGANDNASGTAALVMLADYFAKRNDNARTLVFCAFSGEELGLLGSEDFMNYVDAKKIVAGINLEMLGVPQYGKSTVFITGEKNSNLPEHLKEKLQANGIRVMPEPDVTKQLFMRSDNYQFVKKGVPAHTIMASDDDDSCYHQPCDDVERIDMSNLATITRAIALAVEDLINGKVRPSRVREIPY